jgi:hypothetical protein
MAEISVKNVAGIPRPAHAARPVRVSLIGWLMVDMVSGSPDMSRSARPDSR